MKLLLVVGEEVKSDRVFVGLSFESGSDGYTGHAEREEL